MDTLPVELISVITDHLLPYQKNRMRSVSRRMESLIPHYKRKWRSVAVLDGWCCEWHDHIRKVGGVPDYRFYATYERIKYGSCSELYVLSAALTAMMIMDGVPPLRYST